MWVKRCNEKLWVRTFSLIDGLSRLSWLISGKQAENLSVGKTKSYRTNNIYFLSSLFLGSLKKARSITQLVLAGFVLICIQRVFLNLPCLILYTIL